MSVFSLFNEQCSQLSFKAHIVPWWKDRISVSYLHPKLCLLLIFAKKSQCNYCRESEQYRHKWTRVPLIKRTQVIMVTPPKSLFNSSSFLTAKVMWRGTIRLFLLSRAAFPASSRISAQRYTGNCSSVESSQSTLTPKLIFFRPIWFIKLTSFIRKSKSKSSQNGKNSLQKCCQDGSQERCWCSWWKA